MLRDRTDMSTTFDLLIRGATIVDGSGAASFRGDLGVRDGRVAEIGRLEGARARVEIDGTGRTATPGFIDVHTHDDRLMLSGPNMAAKVSQGVTTVVAGNCGVSLAPFPEGMPLPVTPPLDLIDETGAWFRRHPTFRSYVEALEAAPPAANALLLVGHTSLRVATMDDLTRPASAREIARMRELAREALEAGAAGISTGLHYEPAAAAPTAEVVEVCRPLGELGGLYCTHMRDEGDGVLNALEESFGIGRTLGVPVVISHHKVNGRANHGRSRETLQAISRNMQAQAVGLDCYPYEAASTVLSASRAAGATRTLVAWSRPRPECAGRDLAELAREWGVSQEEAVARLVPAGAIYFSMAEEDVRRILAFPATMIGSDGLPHDDFPHPRLWATFPRVLGRYSRDLGLFPLETAVHKMTGLPARTFGLTGRGVLQAGAWADITLFDAATIEDTATYERPITPARGIEAVIVNGAIVWRDGKPTGARPGRVLHTTFAKARS
jgi:N-acyl-D-amino-acid deacylase